MTYPTTRAVALLIAGILAVPLAGCSTLEQLLVDIDKPTARVVRASFHGLTLEHADLAFDVQVSNPYGVALPLTNVSYEIDSDGGTFASVQAASAGSIPAKGRKTVTLPVRVGFAEILKTLQGVRPGAVIPYRAQLSLKGDVPGIGEVSLPVSKSGELPIPAVPEIELVGIEWDELSLQRASAVATLKLKNTNDFAVDLNRLGYDLSLGGRSVADASVSRPPSLEPGQDATLTFPLSVRPLDAGVAFFNLLRGSNAAYRIRGTMEASTSFGPLNLPFDRSGDVPLRR